MTSFIRLKFQRDFHNFNSFYNYVYFLLSLCTIYFCVPRLNLIKEVIPTLKFS